MTQLPGHGSAACPRRRRPHVSGDRSAGQHGTEDAEAEGTAIASRLHRAKNRLSMVNWECVGASNSSVPFGF